MIANRLWLYHFGKGLVNTPSNFGVMGERPSHPELLDYLAAKLIENKWSLKSIHREIMLSETYRLAYQRTPEATEVDPDNRLLSRANFRRLEAEALRDSMLFVSGTLDERVGGPPQDLDKDDNKKRTLYARAARSPDDFLTLFDYPDPNITNDQREVTNVPTQALFFMNSPLVAKQAATLASRLGPEAADDSSAAARIQRAYRTLFQRAASEAEVARGMAFLHAAAETFDAAPVAGEAGKEPAAEKVTPWQAYVQALLSSGEFIYRN